MLGLTGASDVDEQALLEAVEASFEAEYIGTETVNEETAEHWVLTVDYSEYFSALGAILGEVDGMTADDLEVMGVLLGDASFDMWLNEDDLPARFKMTTDMGGMLGEDGSMTMDMLYTYGPQTIEEPTEFVEGLPEGFEDEFAEGFE
jgi:hypothetical protein